MRVVSRTGFILGLLGAFVVGSSAVPGAQAPTPATRRLELKFNDGKVSLTAEGVTVREIMVEWARQCGCIVQGSDRLTGRVTTPIQFDDQPESMVLESLLRSAGGYLLGPRAPGSHGASIYGSIAVFPVTKGIAAPSYSSPAPIAAPLVTGGTPDDEIPPVTPVTNPQTPPPPPSPGRPGGPAPTTPPGPPGGPGRAAGAGSTEF